MNVLPLTSSDFAQPRVCRKEQDCDLANENGNTDISQQCLSNNDICVYML